MHEGLWTANDRKALRRQVRVPCQVVRESDFTLVADACMDLSPRGMRVCALTPVALDTPVLVSFRVPAAGVHMDVYAVVTRVTRGRRRGERGATLGLSFVDLSAVEDVTLSARLRGLPPPAPARHLRKDYAGAVRAIHQGGRAGAPDAQSGHAGAPDATL
jgi:hypothetical protein